MFAKKSLAALTIAVSACVVVPTGSAAAAPPGDACALVSDTQVSAVLGISVGAGSHVTPTYLKTCTWTPTGADTKGVKAVTISLQAAGSFEGAKRTMEQAKTLMEAEGDRRAKDIANESAVGIGDDAFYTNMGAGYTALLVKKGDAVFKVAIYGALPVQEAKAKEKALALAALSKL